MRIYKDYFNWSDLENLIKSGKNLSEIARLKGCKQPSVRKRAKKLGIKYETNRSLLLKRARKRDGWSEKFKKNNPGFKKGNLPWNKGKPYLAISGCNHWNWQNGKTVKNEILRKSLEYKLWRKSVFERDGYSCVICKSNKSGTLEADHIKPRKLYPNLIFNIDNGRTLCKDCHRKTDTYGRFKAMADTGTFNVVLQTSIGKLSKPKKE